MKNRTLAQAIEKHRAQRERREDIVAVLVTLVAALVVMMLGAPDKWLSAVFVTVVTFSGMISYYWRLWRFPRLWIATATLLVSHLLLMWIIFGVVLRTWNDVALIVCVPGIFVESLFLYYAARLLLGESLRALEGEMTRGRDR